MIKKLFSLGPNLVSPFDPSTRRLSEPDEVAIARKHKLKEQGAEDGENNFPTPDQPSYTNIEISIIREIQKIATRAFRDVEEYVRIYFDKLGVRDTADIADRTNAKARSIESDLDAEIKNGVIRLYSEKKDVIDSDRALEEFKKRNHLSRPAIYPDNRFYSYAVIFLIAVVEIVLNGLLLGDANEFGLIGGVIESVVFTAINIFLGIAMGLFALPSLNHASILRKLTGVFLLLLILSTSIGFNLFIGHYRDALELLKTDANLLNVGQIAVENAKNGYFYLDDFKSWIFTFLGLVMFSVTSWKMFRADDPYPGYGALDRHHKSLVSTYGETFELLQRRIKTIADSGIDTINMLFDSVHAQIDLARESMRRAKSLIQDLQSYYNSLELVCNQLLEIYRSENRKHREDSVPKYWSVSFSMESEFRALPDIDAPELPSKELLRKECSAARKEISKRGNAHLTIYKTIDHLTQSTIKDASVDEIILRIGQSYQSQ